MYSNLCKIILRVSCILMHLFLILNHQIYKCKTRFLLFSFIIIKESKNTQFGFNDFISVMLFTISHADTGLWKRGPKTRQWMSGTCKSLYINHICISITWGLCQHSLGPLNLTITIQFILHIIKQSLDTET